MLTCSNCSKSFSNRVNFQHHVSHKICKNFYEKICPTCKQQFSTKQMCQYHITHKVCESRKTQPKLKLKLKPKLKSNYDRLNKEELVEELIHLKTKYETLLEHPQNINQTNTNNIIVFPNEYGKEDIELITQRLGDILGTVIRQNTFHSIPSLFEKIHNNEKLPEYHNIYTKSEKSGYVLISDGKKFKYKPKKTVIDQIIEDKRSILNDYIDCNGEQLGDKVLKKYEKYQESIDDDPSFRKELEMEIGGLLLDMKSIIADDEKTRELLSKIDACDFELKSSDSDDK